MTKRELVQALEKLEDDDKIGYYDGEGGYNHATGVEFSRDRHASDCGCGCVAMALV